MLYSEDTTLDTTLKAFTLSRDFGHVHESAALKSPEAYAISTSETHGGCFSVRRLLAGFKPARRTNAPA